MKFISTTAILAALSFSAIASAQTNAPVPTPAPEVPAQPTAPVEPTVSTLTIDASSKTDFQFFALEKGQLVSATEKDNWIFAVRRYIFKTNTGVNGTFTGGGYVADVKGFEAFSSCQGVTFAPDESVTTLGYTISANTVLTDWYDYTLEGVSPKPLFLAVARDQECLKFKVDTYTSGVYEISYQEVK